MLLLETPLGFVLEASRSRVTILVSSTYGHVPSGPSHHIRERYCLSHLVASGWVMNDTKVHESEEDRSCDRYCRCLVLEKMGSNKQRTMLCTLSGTIPDT